MLSSGRFVSYLICRLVQCKKPRPTEILDGSCPLQASRGNAAYPRSRIHLHSRLSEVQSLVDAPGLKPIRRRARVRVKSAPRSQEVSFEEITSVRGGVDADQNACQRDNETGMVGPAFSASRNSLFFGTVREIMNYPHGL